MAPPPITHNGLDRPMEPLTGRPMSPVFLALASIPLVVGVFVLVELGERVFAPNLPPPLMRIWHFSRGVLLSLIFAFFAAWAIWRNWCRVVDRVREAEARTREAERVRMHRERLASIGTLAAGIAHEVGNPLASISAIVQILEKKGPDERLGQRLATIQKEIDRISRIIRSLLDYARPPASDQSEFTVASIFDAVAQLVSFDPHARHITIRRVVEPEEMKVRTSRGTLEQVLLNLLLNAVEAMAGRGEITLAARDRANEILIEVSDKGPGISPESRAHIFDPFFTTKEKGTGLGLSISKGLVEEMGGAIEVEPAAGGGTTFRIRLPDHGEMNHA